jgi:thioredoxin reductase
LFRSFTLKYNLSISGNLRLASCNKKEEAGMYDVIIVGGGPAGLSAALLLGRCRRKVIVFDNGKPRNRWSKAMNGFISRDCISPKNFLDLARKDVLKYGVTILDKTIVTARRTKHNFKIEDEDGTVYESHKLLLANGLCDRVPVINGIDELYGISVHHCPYCDGWEQQNKILAAYGRDRSGIGLALSLKTWSDKVLLVTHGTQKLSSGDRALLKRNNIAVYTQDINCLKGKKGHLPEIIFEDGSSIACDALFFNTGSYQQTELGKQLGVNFTVKGVVKTGKVQQTNIEGLYVAGDAAKDMQLVIVAAAEGTKAGVAINMRLQKEFDRA